MQTAYDFYKLLDYPVRRLAVQYGSHWYNIGFYRYGYQWLHCVYVISLGNENTIVIAYVNDIVYIIAVHVVKLDVAAVLG